MKPSRASDRSDLRQALGSDECVAAYVMGLKHRRSLSGIVRRYLVSHSPAQEARRIVDEAMRGASLTDLLDLLYKSRVRFRLDLR
jgi:hypothetical protein